jgi:hypothetical protein
MRPGWLPINPPKVPAGSVPTVVQRQMLRDALIHPAFSRRFSTLQYMTEKCSLQGHSGVTGKCNGAFTDAERIAVIAIPSIHSSECAAVA